MKKTYTKILILFCALTLFTYGQVANANRRINYDSVIAEPQSSFETPMNNRTAKQVKISTEVKDKNEKLYAIVGKSQLLKFDEPVTRVSITEPQYADIVLLSSQELLLNGKKSGRTSLIFWGTNNQPAFFNLIVQQDADAFLQAVEEIAPNENANLIFTDDGVILSGHISSTATKEKIKNLAQAYNFNLVDMSESPTKQVLLEVKITEASRNFTNELASQFSFGQGTPYFVNNVLGRPSGGNISQGSFDGTLNGFQYIFANNSSKLAFSLRAGEKNGTIKVLAEPKLLALDNAEASFNVGNEVPVPSGIGQYGQVSYQFKNTGVILNFKPQILEKSNRVILKLSPEVSEVDDSLAIQQQGGGRIPGFKTRKVDTTVELGDGETLIIAGLLKQTSSKSRTKVPWISNIPVLGLLFTNMADTKDDTELVIFITPKIVEMDSRVGTETL
ncbi:pilus assembly protein N-terminal domain-containing protein [bacterium]|nr:pilus assembly protein N-terminal domain-containing protein [bacterium]